MRHLAVVLTIWAVFVSGSLLGLAVKGRMAKHDQEESVALRWSVAAVAPGACMLAEYLVRAARGYAIEPYMFVTIWPVTLGVLLGTVALAVSYAGLPPGRDHVAVEVVRATHLLAWAFSAYAVVAAFVSV